MLKNLLLALFSLFFTLFLAEVCLQIYTAPKQITAEEKEKSDWAVVPERVWTEYHPQLGWYHQKNRTVELKKRGIDTMVHTNSAGFRGQREYALEIPPGKKRMLVLGDSFAFGFGVADQEVFTAVMESLDPDLEVLNLGVPGYGIDQMSVAYQEIASRYKADYVLLAIFPEDFWRSTRAFADSGHAKPYYTLDGSGKLQLQNVPVPAQFALKTNQYPELIAGSPLQSFLRRSILFKMAEKAFIRLGKNLGLVDPSTETEWVIGRAILEDLTGRIRARGQKPLMMIVPPDRWMNSDRSTSLEKSMIRFAGQAGVPLINMRPLLYEKVQAGSLEDYYIEGDGHWTALSHRLAAEAVLESLSRAD